MIFIQVVYISKYFKSSYELIKFSVKITNNQMENNH